MRSVLLNFKTRFSAILEDFPHLTERFAPNKIFSIKEIIILQKILWFPNSFIHHLQQLFKFISSSHQQMSPLEFWSAPLFWQSPNFPAHLRPLAGNGENTLHRKTKCHQPQKTLTQSISTAMLCSYTSNTSRLICYISTFMFNLP